MDFLPELAPQGETKDLEWMLHSSRVSDAQLIEALLREYYETIYQLAQSRLANPSLAREAACKALALVIHRRGQFWGEQALVDWIMLSAEEVLGEYRKSPQAPPVQPELLSEVDDQSKPADAPTIIKQYLVELRKRARRISLLKNLAISLSGISVIILVFWMAGFSLALPRFNPFNRVRFYYPYTTQPGDTLSSIAKQAGVSVQDISPAKGTAPTIKLDPGITVWIPSLKPPFWQSLIPRIEAVPPPPLTLQSTSDEIKQRILDSTRYWQTLWADQLYIRYGPPGYVSPPAAAVRIQTWIRQPDQSLLLQGDPHGTVLWVAQYRDGSRLYTKYQPGTISSTQFLSAGELTVANDYIDAPFILRPPADNWHLRVIGIESVAGRQALVVDEFTAKGLRLSRLWVDTRLGSILAIRQFGSVDSGSDHQPVLEDRVVLQVQFDSKIDDSMLNPNTYLSTMARDVSGAPLDKTDVPELPLLRFAPDPASADLAYHSPPPGFNPARSRLTLRLRTQFGDSPLDFPAEGNLSFPQTHSIDVYGDAFYLGTQTFQTTGPPQFLSCSRSPDGSLVAFELGGPSSILYWFSMSAPETSRTLPGEIYEPGAFAFSPSSKQLAFFGCGGDYFVAGCGLGLLNFETGKAVPFIELQNDFADWVGWSPDGKTLAAVLLPQNSPFPQGQAFLKLYKISDAQVVYSGSYSLIKDQAAANAPIKSWGAAFQPDQASLKGCALP